jgi:hypothetical protein
MVMYLRRPGGQLQFSRYNLHQPGASGPINELQRWILQTSPPTCALKIWRKKSP